MTERLQDLRQPEHRAEVAADEEEAEHGRDQHAPVGETLAQRHRTDARLGRVLARDRRLEPVALRRLEPARLARRLRQQREHRDAHEHGRHALDDEHELPAAEPEPSVELHDARRERSADHVAQRRGRHEHRQTEPAMARRDPGAEVVEEPRQEPGLGHAEQKPHHVERRQAADPCGRDDDHPPRQHDPREPSPRTDAHQHEVARDLEQAVADEEDPGREPVHGRTEAQVLVHLQRRKADVRAVDEAEEEQQHRERQQPLQHLAKRRRARVRVCRLSRSACGPLRFVRQ